MVLAAEPDRAEEARIAASDDTLIPIRAASSLRGNCPGGIWGGGPPRAFRRPQHTSGLWRVS